MLEVNFYVLPPAFGAGSPGGRTGIAPGHSSTSSIPGGRDLFACKLAEKAYRQGIYSIIYTASEAHSRIIDDLLWTFRNTSFVPHQITNRQNSPCLQQIFICTDFMPDKENLTVINLTDFCPKNPDRCERIFEIVADDESSKQAGRQRYRQYRQLGAKLTTHNL